MVDDRCMKSCSRLVDRIKVKSDGLGFDPSRTSSIATQREAENRGKNLERVTTMR